MSLALPFTIVGLATLASRLTGFLRDVLIAALLGTSAVADVYVAAFLLPNLFRRLMSEGAFNAALVPRLARLESEGGLQAARGFADDALSLLVVVAVVLVAAAEFAMPSIMAVLAPGFLAEPTKFADAVLFGRIAFPFVGLVLVVAFVSALLNTLERYALAALVPLVLNLLLIGVLVALLVGIPVERREAGMLLLATLVLAGLLQVALLLAAVHRAGFPVRIQPLAALRGQIDPEARRLLWRVVPGMIVAGSGHVHMVLASLFASLAPRGMAALYYADRLFQLPLGFVAAAIGVVLLPRVARGLNRGDTAGVVEAHGQSLRFAMLLALPAATGLALLAEPIVAVLFQRAAFSAADAAITATNVQTLAFALPAFVLVKVLLPAFLAREEFFRPFLAFALALAANAATVIVVEPLKPGLGPVAGVVVGAWVNALLLALLLGRRFAVPKGTTRRLAAAFLAAAGMGGFLLAAAPWIAPWLAPEQAFAAKAAALLSFVVSGAAIYFGLARALGAMDRASLAFWRGGDGG